MATIDVVLTMWGKARESMNHFDTMMDTVRIRAFTLFSAITSVAATLFYVAPNTYIQVLGNSLRISAFIELSIMLVVIPLYVQNRLYHYWLYNTRRTLYHQEKFIFETVGKIIPSNEVMLTFSLTHQSDPIKCYWQTMWRSKLFKIDLFIFSFIVLASWILFTCFQSPFIPT